MRRLLLAVLICVALPLSGCDQLGIESASAVAARKEAEGKAVGAGCRHVARSLEDCYDSNRRADKAAVFAGWREMNDYMRENNIEAVAPQSETAVATGPDEAAEPAAKSAAATKAPGKPAAKDGGGKN